MIFVFFLLLRLRFKLCVIFILNCCAYESMEEGLLHHTLTDYSFELE